MVKSSRVHASLSGAKPNKSSRNNQSISTTNKRIIDKSKSTSASSDASVKTNLSVAPTSVTPQYSYKLIYSRSLIEYTVRLAQTKLPDKYINYQPTQDKFYLDTFQHSTKYLLSEPYPGNITVDVSSEPVAELSYTGNKSILTTRLPIVSWGQYNTKYQTVVCIILWMISI